MFRRRSISKTVIAVSRRRKWKKIEKQIKIKQDETLLQIMEEGRTALPRGIGVLHIFRIFCDKS